MANTLVTTDMILNESLLQLENQLVLTKLCNRDYEAEFSKPMKVGQTINETMSVQSLVEGKVPVTVAQQIGADLDATDIDLTMKISDFSDRYIKPQMIVISNYIDAAAHTELYQNCPNWAGTPGQVVNSFSDYSKGPKRLDQLAVPNSSRAGILSPDDYWDTIGSITSLSGDAGVKSALQEAKAHTVGTWGTIPLVNGANQSTTYVATKDTDTMTLNIDGLTATTGTCAAGDVFTMAGVFAVNPISGDAQAFLRQFVVKSLATADGTGSAALTINPPIITSGAYKTCSAVPADNAVITIMGTASTAYAQNLVFHPDAITLAVVPMIKPTGAAFCESRSYKGITLRLIQGFDMTNGRSQWRWDCLFGVKATQPHLATRLSGTA
jgi:P22 coat protein - gene protein 5